MIVPEESTDNISNSCICSPKVLRIYSTWFFISIVLLWGDLITLAHVFLVLVSCNTILSQFI